MLKPLLLVFGVIVVAGALMLGGWALTSGTPAVPVRPAADAGARADRQRDVAGASAADAGANGRSVGQAAPTLSRAQAELIPAGAAKARGGQAARGTQPGTERPGDEDSQRVRRNSVAQAQRLRDERARQADEGKQAEADEARQAQERRQAAAAKWSAEQRRAEQARQAQAARQADAARRAAAAKQAADSQEELPTQESAEEE